MEAKEKNQLDYIVNYWTRNLKVDDINKSSCEKYARALVKRMSSWLELNPRIKTSFTDVKLQNVLMTEIFQENSRGDESFAWEGCKEYLMGNSDEREPRFPEKMDIMKLYDLFIGRKREFIPENVDKCLACHQILALEVILEKKSKCELFSLYQQSNKDMDINSFKFDIVESVDNKFRFIHRTFAEYFLAQCLIKELQVHNQNAKFQKFFIEDVLLSPNYKVVRAFFNNSLRNIVNSLPSNIFHNYQRLTFDIDLDKDYMPCFIHLLATEGCVAILQLLFKCVDFKIIRKRETHVVYVYRIREGLYYDVCKSVYGNKLNMLQFLLRQGGVNIRDDLNKAPIQYAADNGHLDMVKFLVRHGADIEAKSYHYSTALYDAAEAGHLDIVKYLLECGASVDLYKYHGDQSVLQAATCSGAFDIVKLLVKHGASINFVDNYDGNTALHSALEHDHFEIAKFLVENGADVDLKSYNDAIPLYLTSSLDVIKTLVKFGANIYARDTNNNTLLDLVTWNDRWDIAKFLLENGASPNDTNGHRYTYLHSAVHDVEAVRLLIEHGADPNLRGPKATTVLHLAASEDHLDVVKLLVEHGANINCKDVSNRTVLQLAVQSGKLNAVKCFVECGANLDVNVSGDTVLHIAARKGFLDIFKFLVTSGANINVKRTDGRTVLHDAALCNHLDIVKFLIELKVDLNVRDENGLTPLHLAAPADNMNIVKCLVEHIEGVNIRDDSGCTPLHLAAAVNRADIVRFLMEHGSDMNIRSKVGATPLHMAAEHGELELLKYLIQQVRNVNVTDYEGCTALHLAAWLNDLDAVKFFTEHIDVNITNINGCTALHLAVENPDADVMKFLVERVGDVNVRNIEGRTALHIATTTGRLDAVKCLVGLVDVNIRDNGGSTALHLAVMGDEFGVVKLLVDCDANLNVTDNESRTALHLGAEDSKRKIAEFLVGRGIDINIKDNYGFTALQLAYLTGQQDQELFECLSREVTLKKRRPNN